MGKKTAETDKVTVGICLACVFFIFFTSVLGVFTRFFLLRSNKVSSNQMMDIDWQSIYPFETVILADAQPKPVLEKFKNLVEKTEDKFSQYISRNLVGHDMEVELAKKYDSLIGWNFASFGEYNGISQLPDGYLTEYIEEKETQEWAESLIAFRDFVSSQGKKFLYVQAPSKISAYEDTDISGYVDFSNQNADRLISQASENGVDICDLRECIYKEGLHHHGLFYRTDHHWLTTTGLWGAQRILEYCNSHYSFHANTALLDIDQFEQKVYPEWFLGLEGKKVTLSRTIPDDFILLFPKYHTEFHYVVPALGIDKMGDYSVCYNMDPIIEKDYYNLYPYGGCNYGEQPIVTIDNEIAGDDKKILIIHDSFGDCLISALALCEKRVDSLDLRYFTGSVESYVREADPDVVVLLYSTSSIGGEIDRSSHRSMFDFR